MSQPMIAPDGAELAPLGSRFGASVLTSVNTWLAIGMGYGIATVFSSLPVLLVWIALIHLGALVLLVTKAASPGQLALGLVTVDEATGLPVGGKALAKGVIMGLASSLTCGLLLLIGVLITTPGTNQHLFDKLVGVRVVRRSSRPGQPDLPPLTGVPAAPPIAPSSAFLGGAPAAVPPAAPLPAPSPIAPATAAPPPPGIPAGPSDLTVLAGAIPVAPVPRPAATVASWALELDQGSVLPMDRAWVLGRSPVAPPSHPEAEPFAVPDETRSLSKTHLVLAPTGQGIEVTDLHSTNGVTITRPGGAPDPLVAGVPVVVPDGTVLTMGQRKVVVRR